MIALDTSILVRYLLQDDPATSAQASALIQGLSAQAPGWVSGIVLTELTWVLQRSYGKTRSEIALALQAIFQARELQVEYPDRQWPALRMYRTGKASYAKCLAFQVAIGAGCQTMYSLDTDATADAGMEPVRDPAPRHA